MGPQSAGVAAAVCVGVAPVIATAPAAASTDGHVAGELIAIVQDSVKAALGGAAAANLGSRSRRRRPAWALRPSRAASAMRAVQPHCSASARFRSLIR